MIPELQFLLFLLLFSEIKPAFPRNVNASVINLLTQALSLLDLNFILAYMHGRKELAPNGRMTLSLFWQKLQIWNIMMSHSLTIITIRKVDPNHTASQKDIIINTIESCSENSEQKDGYTTNIPTLPHVNNKCNQSYLSSKSYSKTRMK